ncbi:hypothetical protein FVER14953_21337 [Fusarium verticillioides]|nr:hypothetical protein FVER14953_21337 [Fusarium verticillioides]
MLCKPTKLGNDAKELLRGSERLWVTPEWISKSQYTRMTLNLR